MKWMEIETKKSSGKMAFNLFELRIYNELHFQKKPFFSILF